MYTKTIQYMAVTNSSNQDWWQYPEGKDPEEILEQIERDQRKLEDIKKQLGDLSKQLWHDSGNMLGGLIQLSNMIRERAQWVCGELQIIMELPWNPSSTMERLDALRERFSSLERMAASLSVGMEGAYRFVKSIPDDVRKCLEFADVWWAKKEPHEIGAVLQDSVLIWWNHKEVQISLSIPEKFSQIVDFDQVSFQRMMGNFIQNAIRYRKIDQKIAQMEISISSNASGDIILSIKDYGQGMCAKDIESYKQAHKRPVAYIANAHPDSHRIGSASIMQVIESHGWKMDIESEVGEFIIFSITIPAVQSNQSGE